MGVAFNLDRSWEAQQGALASVPFAWRPAADPSERPVDQAIRLLSSSGLRLSLFVCSFTGLSGNASFAVMQDLFADRGVIEVLDDGRVALLLMRFDQNDDLATREIVEALRARLQGVAIGTGPRVEVAALHRASVLVGEFDDLLDEVAAAETRDAWVAVA